MIFTYLFCWCYSWAVSVGWPFPFDGRGDDVESITKDGLASLPWRWFPWPRPLGLQTEPCGWMEDIGSLRSPPLRWTVLSCRWPMVIVVERSVSSWCVAYVNPCSGGVVVLDQPNRGPTPLQNWSKCAKLIEIQQNSLQRRHGLHESGGQLESSDTPHGSWLRLFLLWKIFGKVQEFFKRKDYWAIYFKNWSSVSFTLSNFYWLQLFFDPLGVPRDQFELTRDPRKVFMCPGAESIIGALLIIQGALLIIWGAFNYLEGSFNYWGEINYLGALLIIWEGRF